MVFLNGLYIILIYEKGAFIERPKKIGIRKLKKCKGLLCSKIAQATYKRKDNFRLFINIVNKAFYWHTVFIIDRMRLFEITNTKIMMKIFNSNIVLPLALVISLSAPLSAQSSDVGSTLHHKESVELADVPAGVVTVIKDYNPDFEIQEAQKEFKNGNTYFDVEGLDENGEEIEFDMLLGEDGSWSIAEIQRDLTLAQTPQPVVDLYQENLGALIPARIIESDQGEGVIVYEFFTNENGKEKKYEIKLEVEFLEKEWTH